MFLPSSGKKNNYLKDVYIRCNDLDGDNVTKLDDDTKNYLVVSQKVIFQERSKKSVHTIGMDGLFVPF